MFFDRLFKKKEPVIIVSGLPRSGTSMMMDMLRAAELNISTDGIRTADNDNPRGYYELERVKELDKDKDRSWLREKRGQVVKIISYLLKYLPRENNYSIIFLERNLNEVMASQNKMLIRLGEEANPEEDERMKVIYQSHLNEVKSIIKMRKNMDVLYINHRDIINDPLNCAKRVGKFLKRDLDFESMANIVDPGLYRNRSDK